MDTWINPRWTTLTCFACQKAHARDRLQTVCDSCGLPLEVGYALDTNTLPKAALSGRPSNLWRYAEVLPIRPEHAVTLGEGFTPLVRVRNEPIWIKDESRNPTGSFKARGLALAVSVAKALGAKAFRAPSAGNAAGALAAYGAAAGMPVLVAMPKDTPRPIILECQHYGAEVVLVDGTIADAGKYLREHGSADQFDVSTLREPHRIEGKKTMAYELAEQLDELPDVIVYPTGGGTGLIGMWKAFKELKALGWSHKTPRLVSVQAEGCAPVVKAFNAGEDKTSAWSEPETSAWGLRVPSPLGGFLCLRALRETNGTALAVSEETIRHATQTLAARTGVDVSPEGGAAWAATQALLASKWIRPDERVVVFNTGSGIKYRQ